MNHYVQCLVNSRTGEIEHTVVSDAPLTVDSVCPDIKPEVVIDIPGKPTIPPLTYSIEEFDVDMEEAEGFVQAGVLMEKLEIRGGRVEVKAEHAPLLSIPDNTREPKGLYDGITERVKPARTSLSGVTT